jgi:hypothetical protein
MKTKENQVKANWPQFNEITSFDSTGKAKFPGHIHPGGAGTDFSLL